MAIMFGLTKVRDWANLILSLKDAHKEGLEYVFILRC